MVTQQRTTSFSIQKTPHTMSTSQSLYMQREYWQHDMLYEILWGTVAACCNETRLTKGRVAWRGWLLRKKKLTGRKKRLIMCTSQCMERCYTINKHHITHTTFIDAMKNDALDCIYIQQYCFFMITIFIFNLIW